MKPDKLTLRLSKRDSEWIRAEARIRNMTMSEYIRWLIWLDQKAYIEGMGGSVAGER